MTQNASKQNLFAHPIAFALTNILFPLFALGSIGMVYWLTVEALDPSLVSKMRLAIGAACALPTAAFLRLVAGPKRIGVWTYLGLLIAFVAFAFFAYPLMLDSSAKVDVWIIGPSVSYAFWIGVVPPIFAGLARLTTADWKIPSGPDAGVSILLTILGPVSLYALFAIFKNSDCFWSDRVVACVLVACGLMLFTGLSRFIYVIGTQFLFGRHDRARHFGTTLVFALVLPWLGLALNLNIPFPADFANPWPWILSALTTAVLLPETKANRRGLALWFFKFIVAPFVLYFFILFLPFLPLAVFAILALGMGFLILAPTMLFLYYSTQLTASWQILRERYSKARLMTIAAFGLLVMPLGFVIDVELERIGLQSLVKWHTEEDFDLPPQPLPISARQAERIVRNANDFAEGAEIPFLSAWRSHRVYDGMYMADQLRGELNRRILDKTLTKQELEGSWQRNRNWFGANLFGANEGRRRNRKSREPWRRPLRTKLYTASCESGENGTLVLKVHAEREKDQFGNREFTADFRLPAGMWIEGMRLKMDDGSWKVARASERKAAEFVYRRITEELRDPSIITLDTPNEGTLKIFPVGANGRDVEITLRRSTLCPNDEPIHLGDAEIPLPETSAERSARLVVAKDAELTLIPAAWMSAHINELVEAVEGCATVSFSLNDPSFESDLRRYVRMQARIAPFAPGVMPAIVFDRKLLSTNEIVRVLTPKEVSAKLLTALRREYPGLRAFGDRPLDGWFIFETETNGKVCVPYRAGEGAIVFARLKGAIQDDGAWSEGAKLWMRENEAFMKPTLDVRRELLEGTRRTGVLTTQSAYLAVETSAQEKSLQLKERMALHGKMSFDFEEPDPTEADAPTFVWLLIGLPVAWVLRRLSVIFKGKRV